MSVSVTVDRENVNDESVVARRIYKRHGETVTVDEVVLEIETSKSVAEVRAPEGGTLSMRLTEGDEIAVGGLLFEVVSSAADGSSSSGARSTAADTSATSVPGEVLGGASTEARASRPATSLAERLGVSLQSVPSQGWITCDDVRAAARASGAAGAAAAGAATASADRSATLAPAFSDDLKVPVHAVRMSPRKRAEARALARANASGTTSMIGADVVLDGPRLVRPPYLFEDGISDLIAFEAARLLRRYPDLNACHLDERTIGQYADIHFGISFDSGHNLKVLALRDADRLSLGEVQAGIERLLHLYESEAPIPEELLGCSTVTLSDLSRSGADFMLPLLNAAQSLIIGITRRDRNRFGLYAAFDHRVSEGLQVARFLDELRVRVQSHHHAPTAGVAALRCSLCDQTLDAELRAGGRGLLRIVRADGSDGYLCRNCFEGW